MRKLIAKCGICMIGCIAALGLSGCSEPAPPEQTQDESPASAEEAAADERIAAFMAALAAREAMPGRAIYDAHCAACHNGAVEKAPHRLMIELMIKKKRFWYCNC